MSKDLRTKALIALICLFAGVPALQAQSLLKENFANYTIGDLKGQTASNGKAWALYKLDAGNTAVTNPVQVVEQDLTYPGYADTPSGKAMYLFCEDTQGPTPSQGMYHEGVKVNFPEPISSGTVYCAALMKVNRIGYLLNTQGQIGNNATTSGYFVGFLSDYWNSFRNENDMKVGSLFVHNSSTGKFKFGVQGGQKSMVTSALTGLSSAEFNLGETYLVVFKYDYKNDGAKDDEVSLFVNPDMTGDEPAATCSYKPGVDLSYKIPGLVFRQRVGHRFCSPDVYIDDIRVATSWADLFSSTGGGGTPEPEPEPVVTVDPTTIAFEGDCTIGQTYTKDIVVKATDLKGDITVATTADLSAAATIAKADAEAEAGYTLTVTLTPTSTATASGTVTLTAEGIEAIEIPVTWTPKEEVVTPPVEPEPEPTGNYLLNESFGDYTTGNLKGQKAASTEKNWAAWQFGSSDMYYPIQVEEQSLTYPGYADVASGKAIHVATPEDKNYNEGISIDFADADMPTSGTVYCAALMKFNSIKVLLASNASKVDYFMGFTFGSTYDYSKGYDTRGRLFVQNASEGKFKFGVHYGVKGVNYITDGFGTDEFSFGETCLVVLKYDFKNDGAADDEVSVIVNPDVTAAEPAATHSISAGADIAGPIRGVVFRQRHGTKNCTPDMYIDKVRVATSWADLFGTGGSTGGGGETPEPTPDPVVTVDPTSIAFEGESILGETYTQNIVVKATDLKGDITVATTTDLSAAATIAKADAEAEAGYTLTVTLKPTSTATNSGTVTLTADGIEPVAVDVTWTPTEPAPEPGVVILDEQFNYAAGEGLYGKNGWCRYNTNVANPMKVAAQRLSYEGYATNAKAINLVGSTSGNENLCHGFADNKTFTKGTVYYAALVNVNSLSTSASNNGYFLSLLSSTGTVSDGISCGENARLFVSEGMSSNKFFIGVTREASYGNVTDYGAEYTDDEYAVGQTLLIVMKYQFVDGDKNDVVSLFVNPTVGSTEPAATLTFSGSQRDVMTAYNYALCGMALRQSTDSKDNMPNVLVGGLRAATSWDALFAEPIVGELEPAITVEPESIAFEGDCTIGETYTQNIVVKATDLKGDITVATTADLSATESISKEEAMAAEGYTLTVTLKPTSLERTSGTITLTSEDAATVEIPVTWTPKEAIIPQIDATPKNPMFNGTGQVFTNETYTVDITVTGKDLKGDVTISSNHALVTASPSVVTKAQAEAEGGCKVTLTLQTDASTDMQVAQITISTEGAEPMTLTTMWQAEAAPQYKEITKLSDITAEDIENDEQFKYTGEAIVTYYDNSNTLIYLQDDSRAITIENYDWDGEVQRGDKLTNILFAPNGMGGFWSIGNSQAPTKVDTAQEAAPSIVTVAELKTDAAKYENRLVRLANVHVGWLVDDAFVDMQENDTFTDLTSKPNAVKDDEGSTLTIYAFDDANFVGQPMMSYANVTGISVSADGSMVAPRDLTDFEALVDPNCIHNAQSDLVEVGKGCIRIHAAEAQVTLFDMVGNKLAETTATELSGLAPSVYLLQVTTVDGTTVRKVFVK